MRRLLTITPLLCAFATQAGEPTGAAAPAGRHLAPEAHRAHLLSTLRDMRDGGDLTAPQYEDAVHWVNARPCTGVQYTVPARYRAKLAAALVEKGSGRPARILSLLRYKGWLVVLTESHVSDDPFRFYSGDPVRGAKPVTRWSGGAAIFETGDIDRWVKKNAPGIPPPLADCFAWTVTVAQ